MDTVKFFTDNSQTYWLSIYAPVMLWLTLIFILFVLLLRKYTFGNWTTDHPNPYDGETFNMPRGSMRGLITLTLLYVTVIIEMANVRIIGFEDEFTEFLIAFQMMIAFYFGSKVMHHITSVERAKSQFYAESGNSANVNIEAGSNVTNANEGGDFADQDAEG
jgi:amino acid permease